MSQRQAAAASSFRWLARETRQCQNLGPWSRSQPAPPHFFWSRYSARLFLLKRLRRPRSNQPSRRNFRRWPKRSMNKTRRSTFSRNKSSSWNNKLPACVRASWSVKALPRLQPARLPPSPRGRRTKTRTSSSVERPLLPSPRCTKSRWMSCKNITTSKTTGSCRLARPFWFRLPQRRRLPRLLPANDWWKDLGNSDARAVDRAVVAAATSMLRIQRRRRHFCHRPDLKRKQVGAIDSIAHCSGAFRARTCLKVFDLKPTSQPLGRWARLQG